MTISLQRHTLIGLTALLAGCGGEGVPGLASSPQPAVPIPAPSPTPSPVTALPPVSAAVTPSTTFSAFAVAVGKGLGNPSYAIEVLGPARISIGRDAAGGYSISLPIPSAQATGLAGTVRRIDFSAATAVATPNPNDKKFVARQTEASKDSSGDNTLEISGIGGLRYAQFARLHVCNSLSTIDCDGNFRGFARIAFGTLTPFAEIPVSGSASYKGNFEAQDDDPFFSRALAGQLSLLLDFSARTVAGSLTNVTFAQADALNNIPDQRLLDIAMAGQLGANGYLTGTLGDARQAGSWAGTWSGGLYGPGAAEVAGVLRLNEVGKSDGDSVVGYFGAAKQ